MAELVGHAIQHLRNGLDKADPNEGWPLVAEALHLLTHVETRLDTYASMPDPKFGRIWTERKSLAGVPTFLMCGYDRLAAPTVLYYVALSAAVGRKVDTALTVHTRMEDWPEKRYVD